MFTQVKQFISAVALSCLAFGAQATVLDFEDLPNLGGNPAFFLADYHGFRFGTNDKLTTAWFYSDESTPFYTPQSPTHWISTDFNLANGDPFEPTQSITSAVDFVFNGAYFSGEGQIKYMLYNNGALVYSSPAPSGTLSDTIPLFVASGYAGPVDEIVVLGQQGFWAMDNFTYNEATTVPEPTSLALVLLAGVAGVGVARRSRPAAVAA